MKYLRAIITSDTQKPIYKKDFEVHKVFDIFVRSVVSNMVTTGAIFEREHYSALIIPRYGQYRQMPQTSVTRTIDQQRPVWLSLELEEASQPDTPIDFFTLELFVLEQSLSYRANFQLKVIDYFWRNIEQALVQLGVLGYKENIQRNLYVRDDDEADFEHGEEVYSWQQDADVVVELMEPSERLDALFPPKSLTDFRIQEVKRMLHGKLLPDTPEKRDAADDRNADIHILITRSALESVQLIARSGTRVEQGGILVGNIYEDTSNSGYLVEITDHIAAEGALANEVELRYTFESWQRQTVLLKERFPEKRIVGWYHTHLDLVRKTFYDETRQHQYTTPLFFSQDDIFTHRQFFREQWYVAMVLDPQGNLIFFQWIDNEIGAASKFYIIDLEKEE